MKVDFSKNVTLNLFQGLFRLSGSGYAAQWMLERQSPEVKQVQHDGRLLEAAE
ncbi:MAG: hypothetical protein HEQ34_04365 [Sphingorhabdus sp.]|jgi:hypothetical protein|uniref:hypothetical protein n=1 Tax=Sphingorhabdus sp. TaxID=1902408 RepID=UPI0025D8608A|nr:hypothetical protein [Sphingorhabdus sp.]MCO4091173.1 hypothetical protein [Sphingorhabdus sp.]